MSSWIKTTIYTCNQINSHAEKGDLMDWIIANGAVSQIQSKFWGKQIAAGLHYLHQNSIAHR